ncbi:protein bric-a-brac 1-like [Chrysoperla carnea]|uniref:protein bric-a-brac 1-like n=1 Tax=Chrysoperla carnea TaxID=189513 RepID=UPI001D07BFF0|nr:protein bric-a-brac 1-like [Chrysoperla carnea]
MGDDQQYILRWHHHESTILSGLPELLDADILTDITLSTGCSHIKAHRLVLATCSTYFLELFQDMPSLQHPVVVLKDIDYDDLYSLISFMYRGHCRVSANKLQNLLTTAKMLRIRGLCDMQVPSLNNSQQYNFPLGTTILPKLEYDLQKESCDLNGNIFNEPKLLQQGQIISANKSNNYHLHPPQRNSTANQTSSPTECQVCGKQLSNQYNLRVHLETHENGQHACTVCPHISRSRDALRKHVSYRHPDTNDANCPPRKRCKATANNNHNTTTTQHQNGGGGTNNI